MLMKCCLKVSECEMPFCRRLRFRNMVEKNIRGLNAPINIVDEIQQLKANHDVIKNTLSDFLYSNSN